VRDEWLIRVTGDLCHLSRWGDLPIQSRGRREIFRCIESQNPQLHIQLSWISEWINLLILGTCVHTFYCLSLEPEYKTLTCFRPGTVYLFVKPHWDLMLFHHGPPTYFPWFCWLNSHALTLCLLYLRFYFAFNLCPMSSYEELAFFYLNSALEAYLIGDVFLTVSLD
jgi:hypothetical protein